MSNVSLDKLLIGDLIQDSRGKIYVFISRTYKRPQYFGGMYAVKMLSGTVVVEHNLMFDSKFELIQRIYD